MADQNAAGASGAPAGGGATGGATAPGGGSTASKAAAASEGNPVFRMMGLPNIRFKLPSRNWMIFWTVVGSWTAALVYDRREKRRIQRKWAKTVAHLADEPLGTTDMPRRLTIFLSAPPADGLLSAREHFHEYVKPILVSAALDWDAIEGRREGDIRAGLAERIRKLRRERGEAAQTPIEPGDEDVVSQVRQKSGVREWAGPAGDIIIGRNTWKEYIRGLHEGWLGPLDSPASPIQPTDETSTISTTQTANEESIIPTKAETTASAPSIMTSEQPQTLAVPVDSLSQVIGDDDASPTTGAKDPSSEASGKGKEKEPEKKEEEEEEKAPAKRTQPLPFNSTSDYATSSLPPTCPPEFAPASAIVFPHILGFFNTPIRMYRFLNRRHLADQVGRETAAAVLGLYRPFSEFSESSGYSPTSSPSDSPQTDSEFDAASSGRWEQAGLLESEEPEWHKSVRKPSPESEDSEKERIWMAPVVLDSRIAERMRRFELEPEEEERATRLSKEEPPWWQSVVNSLSWLGDEKKPAPAWQTLKDEELDDD